MATRPGTALILREIRKLERYLNGLKMVPATDLYRSKVILALLSKALTVGRAVCALVDAGFPGEAFGLSRTLTDIYFCVRYIGNKDTESRAETFAKYDARVRLEWQNVIHKHFPQKTVPALDTVVLETAKEFKSKSHWTGHGGQAKLMALEEDTVEVDAQGQPVKSEFDYDAIYFWTSHFVHVTVDALDGHAGLPGEVFRVRARIGREKKLGKNALFNTAVFLSKTFVCALHAMNEEQPRALEDLYTLTSKF